MKLSKNFVKDYVDIDVDIETLADDMTRVGNEYDSAEKLVNATKLIIGEVKEKGNKVITMGDNLDGYEGFVKSEIDAFNAELDSIVNYKFGRIGK